MTMKPTPTRPSPPGYLRCELHGLLFAVGANCDQCAVAFRIVAGNTELADDRWLHSERHTCATAFVGPCRACAQDRVAHDAGDEQPEQFCGRRGLWLVGGGRNHAGTLGGETHTASVAAPTAMPAAQLSARDAHHATILRALDLRVQAACAERGVQACDGLSEDQPCELADVGGSDVHSATAEFALAMAWLLDEPGESAHDRVMRAADRLATAIRYALELRPRVS